MKYADPAAARRLAAALGFAGFSLAACCPLALAQAWTPSTAVPGTLPRSDAANAAQQAAAAASLVPKVWMPNPALLPQLAASPTQFGRYSLRPPHGYKEVSRSSKDGFGTGYYFSASGNPDLDVAVNAPSISIVEATPPKDKDAPRYTVEQVMLNLVTSLHDKYGISWRGGFIEHGTINGVAFSHDTWSGSASVAGPVVSGSIYGTMRPNGSFVLLVAESAQPASAAMMPLLDASVATFTAK